MNLTVNILFGVVNHFIVYFGEDER